MGDHPISFNVDRLRGTRHRKTENRQHKKGYGSGFPKGSSHDGKEALHKYVLKNGVSKRKTAVSGLFFARIIYITAKLKDCKELRKSSNHPHRDTGNDPVGGATKLSQQGNRLQRARGNHLITS
jgi:hypothetical protein